MKFTVNGKRYQWIPTKFVEVVGVTLCIVLIFIGMAWAANEGEKKIRLQESTIEDVEIYPAFDYAPQEDEIAEAFDEAEEKGAEYLPVLNSSSIKTYMDYRAVTDTTSKQWGLLQNMKPNKWGIMETEDGYMAVALGSFFGEVGNKFVFTIGGKDYKLIKADAKANAHTDANGFTGYVGDVIEFIIDSSAVEQYRTANGYIFNGNYNNVIEGRIEAIKNCN